MSAWPVTVFASIVHTLRVLELAFFIVAKLEPGRLAVDVMPCCVIGTHWLRRREKQWLSAWNRVWGNYVHYELKSTQVPGFRLSLFARTGEVCMKAMSQSVSGASILVLVCMLQTSLLAILVAAVTTVEKPTPPASSSSPSTICRNEATSSSAQPQHSSSNNHAHPYTPVGTHTHTHAQEQQHVTHRGSSSNNNNNSSINSNRQLRRCLSS